MPRAQKTYEWLEIRFIMIMGAMNLINVSLHAQQDGVSCRCKVCNDASQKFSTALEQYRRAIKFRQVGNCQ